MAYAGTADLIRVLRLQSVTAAQGTALERVLETAATEIDFECFGGSAVGGTATAAGSFATPYPPLVVEVNLERAVEHWRQAEAPFGLIGIGDSIPILSARDSWDRHAHKLSPVKNAWGVA